MSDRPSTLQALFAEMMRRRVFRVMAVYGATSFVLLQVADLLAEGMGLSEQVLRVTTFAVLIGFPIAIVLAWAFETTPDGVRRTQPAAPEEIDRIVSAPLNQRWPAGLLALAGMGLLFWGGWWMGNRGVENPANIIVSAAQASEFKALAVLPFQDVNQTDENRLIAVGVHEDLLTQLQRISALRVTGSASVREYDGTEKSFDEIAGELGVDYLLDGSVRSSGDRVRVVVALLDAASGEQLWREQYDEEVSPDNLFDIQSRIARVVVGELEAEFTAGEQATLESLKPAASSVAQQWYYRGVDSWSRSSEIREARDAMQRAVDIDPDFLAAWARLAWYESRLHFVAEDRSSPAAAATARTEELGPGTVEAYLARGYYEYYVSRDFAAALSAFRQAERLAPSDSDVASSIGLILRRQGDWRGSVRAMKRAVDLDPRNTNPLQFLAEDLAFMGSFRAADAVLDRALSLDPAHADLRAYKVTNLMVLDRDPRRAQRLAAELDLDARVWGEARGLYDLARNDRDLRGALAVFEQADARGIYALEAHGLLLQGQVLSLLDDPAAVPVSDSLVALVDRNFADRLEDHVYRGSAHATAGRREAAMQTLAVADAGVRRWEDHVDATRWGYWTACAYGLLGEVDRGIAILEFLIDRPSVELSVATLLLDPAFDPFRDDPRFEDLIERREAFEAEAARWAEENGPWLP
jgi:TolB-like protein/Tfp pilus assembly protein PilF